MKKERITSITTLASICLVIALVFVTPGIALSKVTSENPASATDVSAYRQPASSLVAQNNDDQGEDNDDQLYRQPTSSLVAQNNDDQGEDNDDQLYRQSASPV